MVIDLIIRHFINDDESLASFLNGQYPKFSDVKRRVFLRERSENRFIPDHHYRMVLQKNMNSLDDLRKLLTIGVFKIASEHFELRGSRVFVLQEKQLGWQKLVTYMPPLILQASYLSFKKPLISFEQKDLILYFSENILPNVKYTALPSPYIPQLASFLQERNGLHDLHVHLNGATETDLVWPIFLASPDNVYKDLMGVFGKPKVKEHFEQESHLLTPLKFYQLLIIARRIRQVFFDFVFGTNRSLCGKDYTPEIILAKIININRGFEGGESIRHPFLEVIQREDDYPYPMAIECLMFVCVFKLLEKDNSPVLVSLFHFYLLILGLSNRLLVQQTHQFGFEQFQKHTLNGLREFSEREYLLRFLQMNGNELNNISFIEGRFSPQDSTDKCMAMLHAINKGWERMIKIIKLENGESYPLPELKLTAHFIKKEDSNPGRFRHYYLRKEVWSKGIVLSNILKNYPALQDKIVGVDAAASEFDAPPETFAPLFRMMRRVGMKHFTYHAGEDFHHIVSGLRAVYEATVFTGLMRSDRIGHAVATGISVDQWSLAMGNEILIPMGEWLDDLIFAYHLIICQNIDSLKNVLPNLINEMVGLAHKIYGKFMTPGELEEGWLLRQYCPFLVLCEDRSDARKLDVYDEHEWCSIQNQKIKPDAKELLQLYHNDSIRQAYQTPFEVSILDLFGKEGIQALQLGVLKFLHDKEIVIETLPTSNIRIGHHHDYSTYHLWNWLKWEKQGHLVPPIVIGTDDTGIFATNIFNEYANIYCHLTNSGKMNHHHAMEVIERLEKNSRIYKFKA